MESSINTSTDTNIIELLDDLYSDVPLVATYLKILLLLVAIPAIITPASVIIHIIRKTKELHTKYCLFLVNLLISDILTTVRYCFEIFIMVLYLLNIRIHISVIAYVIITIARVVTRYSFVLLAIDRVVGVAFPYRYRNIMKPRVVYVLIASVWIIAAMILFVSALLVPVDMMWPFGDFVPKSGHYSILFLYLFPLAVSAILIFGTNLYLYRTIIQSKKKLENNLKLSGKDEHKVTKFQRLIHNLQLQLESSLPVFILGGVDCLLNLLRVMIFAIINIFYPLSSNLMLHIYVYEFFANPLEYFQIISHSITYGFYKKEVKKRLHRYYQCFQRLLPLRPRKVIILDPQ